MTRPSGSSRLTGPPRHEPPARFDTIWREFVASEAKAERVAQHAGDRRRFLETLEGYARAARPPRIVEVGCGSAIDLCLLRGRVGRGLALGLDLSWDGLGAARAFAEHLAVPIALTRGDTFALPLRSASAGLVFSQGLLEHFREPGAALAEQARVLAPGGVLVVSVPQAFTGYTLHKRRAIRAGTWPWGWEDQYSARRLRRLGESVGLRVEAVFGGQYWRAWGEPAWVLRDLVGKVERRLPAAWRSAFRPVAAAYDRAWSRLEARWGHWFLQNVVVVFRAPGVVGEAARP